MKVEFRLVDKDGKPANVSEIKPSDDINTTVQKVELTPFTTIVFLEIKK